MVKSLEFFFSFFKPQQVLYEWKFWVLVESYSILPVRLQLIMKKALFLCFFQVSIDYLFDNLESGKETMFWKKDWKKS